jgi:tetratricopeptide (TPR) repeat protein
MKKYRTIFTAAVFFTLGLHASYAQQDFSTLYNDGIKKIGEKNYSQAIGLLNQAIQQKPDFAEAFFARGGAFLMLHKREEACADFQVSSQLKWKPSEEYIRIYCNPNSPGMHSKPIEAK